MLQSRMGFSGITPTHENYHLCPALLWLASSGLLQCLVKGESVTAASISLYTELTCHLACNESHPNTMVKTASDPLNLNSSAG